MSVNKKELIYSGVLIGALALVIIINVFAPRPLALVPGLIGLAAFLSYRCVFGGWPALHRSSTFVFTVLLLFALIGTLWAYDPGLSLERSGKMASLLIPSFLLLAAAQSLPARLASYWLWLIPAALALSLMLIMVELRGDFTIWRFLRSIPEGEAVFAHTMNRPLTGAALLFFPCAGIIWYAANCAARVRAGLLSGLTVLMIAAAVISSSEAALLALTLGATGLFLFPFRWKAAWAVAGLILVLGIMTAPWTMQAAYKNYAEQVNEMPFIGLGGGHGAQRLEIYNFVGREALERPLIGHGIEAARAMVFETDGGFYSAPDATTATIFHPHNFALQLWLEFGLIGALAGTALSLFMLWRIYLCGPGPLQRILLASFISFLAMISVSYNLWHGWGLGLFILLGAVLLMHINVARKEPESCSARDKAPLRENPAPEPY